MIRAEKVSTRFWAYCWLIIVSSVFVISLLQKPQFDSSLMSLLPISEQQPEIQKAKENLTQNFDNKLLLVLRGNDSGQVKTAVIEVAKALDEFHFIDQVKWRLEPSNLKDHKRIEDYRFSILSPEVLRLIDQGDFALLRNKALSETLSPMSFSNLSILEDPFGLNRDYLKSLESRANFQIDDGYLKVKRSIDPAYIIFVSFGHSAFDPKLQSTITDFVDEWSSSLALKNIELLKSGMVLHAAAGAEQANSEMKTIGVGSLVGIVLCIILVFKRLFPILLLLLPVLVGCVTAFSLTVLLFEKVHLITLAFGAGLIGVSVDYALHFLCERHKRSATATLKKLFPGMCLGLLTSVLAYSAQALAPFPGLRQMALFSVVGLIGAWLTVMLWFPILTDGLKLDSLKAAKELGRLREKFPTLGGQPLSLILLSIMSLVTVVIIYDADKSIDIRELQAPSERLLAEDSKVQELLGLTSSAKFLLVSGRDLQESLDVERGISQKLDLMIENGLLEGYQALSTQYPSLTQQRQNAVLVTELYNNELNNFFGALGLGNDYALRAKSELEKHAKSRLAYEEWLQMPGNRSWENSVVFGEDKVSLIIRLQGDFSEVLEADLARLAAENFQVQFVNQVADISLLLKRYQEQIFYWVIAAYLIIAVVLYIRYRLDCWRILLPPFMACLLSLSLISYLEGSLNVFHLMAMILVIGIGLDLGIFMFESEGADYTWLASSLSCYTSLLAFGLLAVSETQVLHHFGMTVLIGLVCVWLISPLVRVVPSVSEASSKRFMELTRK